ncbi:hypothetical protein J6590_068192 [Homalodisca vitripennis]|nr:hypothetical protein J6590_068192 [Homalodisca vitripennis]
MSRTFSLDRLKSLLDFSDWPYSLCREYSGYRYITESSNVQRGCCLDGIPLNDPVLESRPPVWPLVVVRLALG